MIIICSGPDTYRARERARELVGAFHAKHDPSGLAFQSLDGPLDIATLLSNIGTGSLFTKKKMVRADGCLAKMKIADVRYLAARLEMDKDQTILLTLEQDVPAVKTLEALKEAPLFHYPFPIQTGAVFRSWVRERAKEHGVSLELADQIVEKAVGDSWFAMNELQKMSVYAGASSYHLDEESLSVFDAADAALVRRPGWMKKTRAYTEDGLLPTTLSQIRSYLRIRSGSYEGIHPFVVKKMGSLKIDKPEERFLNYQKIFSASRSGVLTEEESDTAI